MALHLVVERLGLRLEHRALRDRSAERRHGELQPDLTLAASTSAPYGTYTITVKGTSGPLVRSVQLTVVVPSPDFGLKLSATSGTTDERVYVYCSLAITAGTPVGTYYVTFTGRGSTGSKTVSPKITIS